MPGFEADEGRRVDDDVIAAQEEHAERVEELRADSDYDQLRGKPLATGWGRWLPLLLLIIGVIGFVLFAYWISLWLLTH